MPIDVAHLLGLNGGCVQEHAEFQYFICPRDAAGTKTDHTNGHHCQNATAIHDFILPVFFGIVVLLCSQLAGTRKYGSRSGDGQQIADLPEETVAFELHFLLHFAEHRFPIRRIEQVVVVGGNVPAHADGAQRFAQVVIGTNAVRR